MVITIIGGVFSAIYANNSLKEPGIGDCIRQKMIKRQVVFVFISLICFLPYTLYKILNSIDVPLNNNVYCNNLENYRETSGDTFIYAKIITRMFSHSAALL